MKIITHQQIKSLGITPRQCVEWIYESFFNKNQAQLPAKISVHPSDTDFFTSMPCLLPESDNLESPRYFGIKEVHRIAGATPSLGSDMMLYNARNGELLALADCDWVTTMRTGAVAAVTAKALRKDGADVYGFIGLGNTARATLLCVLEAETQKHFKIKLLKYKNQADIFIERFQAYNNVTFDIVDTKEELADTLKNEGVEIDMDTLLPNSLYVRKTSNIGELESYKKGLFHIMDESSMLATRILNPSENSVVIDVCSAPGGKSFATAEIMKNTGKVISRDIYEHKAELIKEGADRLGLTNVEVQVKDASEDNEDIKADFVLVDAPCSGLGLVRKKPDIKNNKTMADVEELASLQRKILAVASKKVKKDGILVYSTCTVSEKENVENVRWFVDNFDFEPVDFSELLPEKVKYETAKKGYIEILPSDYGTDGFFISKFRRK